MKNEEKSLIKLTTMLIIITTALFIARGFLIFRGYKQIASLEDKYTLEKNKAENNIKKDKEIWDKINSKTRGVITNSTDKNYSNESSESIENLKAGLSNEFSDAIEWAERENMNYSVAIVTPFDKEGYLDTYYTEVNNVHLQITEKNATISNNKTSETGFVFTLVLLIVELIMTTNSNFKSRKTKWTILGLAIVTLISFCII